MQPENAPQLRVTRSNCDKSERDNLPNRYPQPTTFNRDVLLFPFTIGSDGNGHSSTVRALSEHAPPDPRHGKPVSVRVTRPLPTASAATSTHSGCPGVSGNVAIKCRRRIWRSCASTSMRCASTGWAGAEMTPRNWRRSVAERLDLLDGGRAATDLRPFLERREDIELAGRDNVLRLLT